MRFRSAATCLAVLAAALAAPVATTAADLGDGLYSAEQAARGAEAYRATCSSCHALDLRGNSNSPGLRGIGFLFVWEGRSLGELYNSIRTTMPQESPNSLTQGQYLDILAYILEQNGYPAGGANLADAPGELDAIVISAP